MSFSENQAASKLRELLRDIGYGFRDVERIMLLAKSSEIARSIAEQRSIAEEDVRTIKIPTLIMNGRRYDRVVDVDALK